MLEPKRVKRLAVSVLVSLSICMFPGVIPAAENLLTNPDAETGDTQGWVDPDEAWGADSVAPGEAWSIGIGGDKPR